MSRTLRGTLALLMLASGCADISKMKANVCGNAVIEPGEDCDSFSPLAEGESSPDTARITHCGDFGTIHACRYLCSESDWHCPTGWSCGNDAICRAPMGEYEAWGEPLSMSAYRLRLADFDGDKRKDLLIQGHPDGAGRSFARLHYFDTSGRVSAVHDIGTPIGSPVVTDLTGDGYWDLVFSHNFSGLGVLRGQADQTVSSMAYPSLVFPADTKIAILLINALVTTQENGRLANEGDEIAVLFDVNGTKGLTHSSAAQDKPLVLLPGGPNDLASPMLVDDFITTKQSPCKDIVLGFKNFSDVYVVSPCEGEDWAIGIDPVKVSLPVNRIVDRGVRSADFNNDGRPDLLIGASDSTFLAYSDGEGNFWPAPDYTGEKNTASEFLTPVDVDENNNPREARFPLAVADLNHDNQLDYVTSRAIFVSTSGLADFTFNGIAYRRVNSELSGGWTEAAVGDFNKNGVLDVIAASPQGIGLDLFSGTDDQQFVNYAIPTQGVAEYLRVGDFDGDTVNDLAFVDSPSRGLATSAAGQDQLSILYGRAFGAPQGPVRVGEVGSVGGLCVGNIVRQKFQIHPDGASDLGLVYTDLFYRDQNTTIQNTAILEGDASRRMIAPYGFVAFDHSDVVGIPVGVVTGKFNNDEAVDVAAFVQTPSLNGDTSVQFWVGMALGGQGRLSPPSDGAELAVGALEKLQNRWDMTLLAGDLDNSAEHLDELVALFPPSAADPTKSFLVVARLGWTGEKWAMNASSMADLPFTIRSSEPAELFDFDGDGLGDLVLTAGIDDIRKIVVLWNDGSGRLQLDGRLESSFEGSVRAFARRGDRALIVLTNQGVFELSVTANRSFSYKVIDGVPTGDSVAVGDLDGDGLDDIVVGDVASVRAFRMRPVLQ